MLQSLAAVDFTQKRLVFISRKAAKKAQRDTYSFLLRLYVCRRQICVFA